MSFSSSATKTLRTTTDGERQPEELQSWPQTYSRRPSCGGWQPKAPDSDTELHLQLSASTIDPFRGPNRLILEECR